MTSSKLGIAILLAAMAVPIRAGARDSDAPTLLSPDAHVRAVDRETHRLLEGAVACSPTVSRMVTALQASDLIVTIEMRPMQKIALGDVRIVAATRETRYLRLGLKVPNGHRELLSLLGHELQHAIEVAGAPQVRDAPTLRAYYQRIGWAEVGDGYFETEAALEAGRVVARDVAGCGRAAANGR